MRVIDAHVHVWSGDRLRYPFAPHDGLPVPAGACGPGDFLADAAGTGLQGILLIQPRLYGYDHAYLFAAAARLAADSRVMPLVNVARPGGTQELRRLAAHKLTAAFRVVALDGPPADWLCSPEAHHAWEAAAGLELPVGMLVDPSQLAHVCRVAAAHPDLTIIVDHLGRIAPALRTKFTPSLRDLAVHRNVHVKMSAVGSLSRAGFPYTDMWPLIAATYHEFGAPRLLWGSDWPHTRSAGAYSRSQAAIREALAFAPHDDLDAIFATTAARLFDFPSPDATGGHHGDP